MSLSVAMIVKNEGKTLRRCLDSIVPIADELSIVDTGSTDNTVDLIKKFDKDHKNINVFLNFHKWEDGYFSGNRNYGLQFCTKNMILWVDADEWVYPESYPEIENISKRGDVYSCFCSLLSDLPDGRVSKHYLPKIFRRGTARFEGIVHNQLIHASPTLITGVKIHHTGYALDPEVMKKKRKRTSDLLRIQIEEKEDNAFAYMNLSRTMMNDQNYKESIEIAEKGLQYGSSDDCRQMLYYSLAICAIQLEDYEKAEKTCWDALRLNPTNLDMTFVLSNIFIKKKEWEKAIIYLNRYIQLKEKDDRKSVTQQLNFLITDFYEARDKAFGILGICYTQIERKDLAAEAYRKAIGFRKNPQILGNLALMYEEQGLLDQAKEVWYHMTELGFIDEIVLQKLGVK